MAKGNGRGSGGGGGGALTGATPPGSSAQWPGMLSRGQQYPEMPVVPDDRPLLQNLGASGVAIFSGVITSEEYNEDFYWRDATKIYEQMLRSEAQIAAIRNAIELPIRRAAWSIQPASADPMDVQIAAFVDSCLFRDMAYTTTAGNVIRQKWDDILRHVLMHLWYGYMAFEQVWRVEDGWVKWARWTPLLPRTIWRWWVGEDNELTGIEQWTFKGYNYQFAEIPAEKLLLFVNRQEGNNYEGVSLLRPVYKNWYFVQQFEKIEAIAEERNAVSIPVVQLPQGFTAAELQAAQSIVQNARVNELMGITLPPGWNFDYPKNQQKYAAQSQPSIQYHQGQIARAILADFLQSTTNGHGSYAQTSSRIDFFLLGLQSICEYIEDVINTDAIRRLVDYNFVGVSDYPKLKASKLTSADMAVFSTALAELVPAGLVDVTPEVKAFVAEVLGLPTSPQSAVQTTNPSAPDDGTDDGNGNGGGENEDGQGEGDQEDDTRESENVNGLGMNGMGDRASEAAALSEVRAEMAAVRLALAEVDAVGRALGWDEESVKLYNPYPRGPHGHFGEGGMGGMHAGGGGGGAGTGGVHGQGAAHSAEFRGGSGGGGGGARSEKGEGEKATRARSAKVKESPEEKRAALASKVEDAKAEAERAAQEITRTSQPGTRAEGREYNPHAFNSALNASDRAQEALTRAQAQLKAHDTRQAKAAAKGPKESPEENASRMQRAKEERATARAEAAAKAKAERAATREQAKAEAKAAREVERMHAQTGTAKGEGAKGEEGRLKPVITPEEREQLTGGKTYRIDPFSAPDGHYLRAIYGDKQLKQSMRDYSADQLRRTAEYHGLSKGGSKAALIDRVYDHVTSVPREESLRIAARNKAEDRQEVRGEKSSEVSSGRAKGARSESAEEIGARGGKAGKAEGEGKGEKTQAYKQKLTVVGHLENEHLLDAYAGINPHALKVQYGEEQLRSALGRYTTEELGHAARSMETQTGDRAPTSGRAKMLDYLASHAQADEHVAEEFARVDHARGQTERAAEGAKRAEYMRSPQHAADMEAMRQAQAAKVAARRLTPVGEVSEKYLDPYRAANPHALRALYGDAQLSRALGRYSTEELGRAARIMERQTGERAPRGNASKTRLVNYLAKHASTDPAAMEAYYQAEREGGAGLTESGGDALRLESEAH